jgi:hypothetical protein
VQSKEVETGWSNLAESSKEGNGPKRTIFSVTLMIILILGQTTYKFCAEWTVVSKCSSLFMA